MLKRDAEFIKKNIYEKDNKLFTRKNAIIEIPKIFEDKNMFAIEKNVSFYGVFALLMEDKYSVSVIPTMLISNPLSITEIERDDTKYIQLVYGEDIAIIENVTVARNKLLSYNLFELFFSLGKIPWYIEYEDILRILDNLPHYAESNLGDNFISNEILVSFITRYKENPRLFVRQIENIEKNKYIYVDLENPYYSITSTVTKIGGSYFSEGLISALVEKEKEPTKLENLVRY